MMGRIMKYGLGAGNYKAPRPCLVLRVIFQLRKFGFQLRDAGRLEINL